jgi:hypothetical protein
VATSHLVVDVRGIPELIHGVMSYTARVLREEADAEADPRVAVRLRQIAARIETGA